MEAIVLDAMRLLEGLFKALGAYLELRGLQEDRMDSEARRRPKHLKK